MERDKIYYVLFEQQKDFKDEKLNIIPRELTQKVISFLSLKLPIVITGVRRTGKSTLLKILTQELKLGEKDFLYVNFNDERLISFIPDDFQKIMDFLEEQNYHKNCYFLIDEIQEVNNWEKWIDRIKEKHPIIITGSNSKMLSKEISTVLTGRSINVSLYPFSFREFLKAKMISSDNAKVDLKVQSKIRAAFSRYLESGGIPKAIMEDERILMELYENIIYRDIIKRFNYHLEKPIKEISNFLLANTSKESSLRAISETTGITNLLTTKAILDTFEKAFFFFFVNRFDYSLRKQAQSPRKVYCVDNGFITKAGFRFSEDKGKLLENLVFIELKRKNQEVYYFSGKKECDFIVKEKTKVISVIQISYFLTDENKNREINGLLEAMEEFKLNEGLLLTDGQEEEIKLGRKKILVKPVWNWLLEES
ncbi:ATP-binding protein [archaeon]|nr:ATP-binding protein [archaeon]